MIPRRRHCEHMNEMLFLMVGFYEDATRHAQCNSTKTLKVLLYDLKKKNALKMGVQLCSITVLEFNLTGALLV